MQMTQIPFRRLCFCDFPSSSPSSQSQLGCRRRCRRPPTRRDAAAGGDCAPRRGCCLAGLRLPLSSSLMSNKLIGRLRTTFLPRCESIKPTVYYFFPTLGNSGCGVFEIRNFVYPEIFKLGMFNKSTGIPPWPIVDWTALYAIGCQKGLQFWPNDKMASYKFSANNQCEIYVC